MHREILIIVAAVAIAVVAWLTLFSGQSIGSKEAVGAVPVPFSQITQGTQSKVTERVNYLVTSSVGLKELWKLIDAPGTPPSIDFSTQAVAAVFAGERSSGGYNIAVSKVVDANTARTVYVMLSNPGVGCATTQALIAPYEVIVLPVTALPLTHKDESVTKDCQ